MIPESEKYSSEVIMKLVLWLRESFAGLAEECLIVDLHTIEDTLVCLAYCHHSFEV